MGSGLLPENALLQSSQRQVRGLQEHFFQEGVSFFRCPSLVVADASREEEKLSRPEGYVRHEDEGISVQTPSCY
jgi:hypothetical protein